MIILTDEQKFEIYKEVKRELQRGYYANRSEEQVAKRKAYLKQYHKKRKGEK